MQWIIAVVGCVVLGLLFLYFEELVTAALRRLRRFLGRAADRESLADNRVSCGLRAASSRVYNIGTEWSTGSATLSRGRMIFEPTMGIVRKRDIAVTSVEITNHRVDDDEHVVLRLHTPQGELFWRVSAAVADRVSALVRG